MSQGGGFVRADGGSIAAGRDVTIQIVLQHGQDIATDMGGAALETIARLVLKEAGDNLDNANREMEASAAASRRVAGRVAGAASAEPPLQQILGTLGTLNRAGQVEEAAAASAREVEKAARGGLALSGGGFLDLVETAIDQHRLAQDAAGAAAMLQRKLEAQGKAGPALVAALLAQSEEMLDLSGEKGTRFEIELAVHLSAQARAQARSTTDMASADTLNACARMMLASLDQGPAEVERAMQSLQYVADLCYREGLTRDWVEAVAAMALGHGILGFARPFSGHAQESRRLFETILHRPELRENPKRWGRAHMSYGITLRMVARQQPFQAAQHLNNAVAAIDAALQVFDPEQSPFDHVRAIINRSNVLGDLLMAFFAWPQFQEAERDYLRVLEMIAPEDAPMGWAHAKSGLAHLYCTAAQIGGGVQYLQAAQAACDAAEAAVAGTGSSNLIQEIRALSLRIHQVRMAIG